jgi:hypothetical protein
VTTEDRMWLGVMLMCALAMFVLAATARNPTTRIIGFLISGAIVWSSVFLAWEVIGH